MVFGRSGSGVVLRAALGVLVAGAAACAAGGSDGPTGAPQEQTPAKGGGTPTPEGGSTPMPGTSDDASSNEVPDGAGAPAPAGDDALPAPAPDAAPACVTGQVTADEVVMLGDSYLDPAWGNVGPTLMTQANAMYRHYYIGGASLAWGNPDTQFFIPYQYDPMARTDTTVANPTDIKVVIMDGGGNDVLIGNTSCETTAPPANTSCVTTVQNAIDETHTQLQKMASQGVQSVVFFFYPHLSTAGGGILSTPAPAVNDTLDYAYPLAEQVCCGSSFTSTLTNYSCAGQPAAGLTCVFVDTRPAFEGHLADYIKSDNVHPTQAGATVISNLLWTQMQNHCIAQ